MTFLGWLSDLFKGYISDLKRHKESPGEDTDRFPSKRFKVQPFSKSELRDA